MQTDGRYSAGAIWLHWIIALGLAFQIGLGFAMPRGPSGFAAIQFHKSIGITILVLSLARIAWRIIRKPPAPLDRGPVMVLAKTVHAGLYAFMLLAPLTGWALVSTARVRIPTLVFGTVPLPHLPLAQSLNPVATEAHSALAWIGIALIALHVAGALRHHVLLHDRTLARMAPGGAAMAGLLLLVLAALLTSAPFAKFALQHTATHALSAQPGATPVTAAVSLVAQPSKAEANSAAPSPADSATATPVAEPGPPPAWAIAPGGSLRFSIGNGDSRVEGRFARWSGTIRFDPDAPQTADIRISVDLASASVGDPTQDSMLHGPDFLGPAGTATWRSTAVRKTGEQAYAASGTLTLNGHSRPVPLSFTLRPFGERMRATGQAVVDREAFGVGKGDAAASLSPDVSIKFDFSATKQ